MGDVAGEGGAVVEGYGAALDRFSQELVRMMREQRVLVIWLFDESESMKDDQQDLKGRLHRIYEELKLVDKDDSFAAKRGKGKEDAILLTSIMSFGEKTHFHLNKRRPTSDEREIMKAVDAIPIDRTGRKTPARRSCRRSTSTRPSRGPATQDRAGMRVG